MEERKTIYLCLAHMSEAGIEQKYVKEAFDTNWVVPMGPNVNAFEKDLEAFANSKSNGTEPLDRKVVCLSAGTAAVHLALIGCGVKAGDEVLVQSFTFCASSHPITYLGAKPVFVGSEGETWNMDPALLEKAIIDRKEKRENIRRRLCLWLSMVCLTASMRLWRLPISMAFPWWKMQQRAWARASMVRCLAHLASMACCRSTAIR